MKITELRKDTYKRTVDITSNDTPFSFKRKAYGNFWIPCHGFEQCLSNKTLIVLLKDEEKEKK